MISPNWPLCWRTCSTPPSTSLLSIVVSVSAQVAANASSAQPWTWVNPGQQLLCVGDVTPQCANDHLPDHLAQIFRQLEATSRPSHADILVGLLYAVALECGFYWVDANADAPDDRPADPAHWWSTFDLRFVRYYATRWPSQSYDYENDFYRIQLSMFGVLHGRPHCTLIVRDIGGTLCVSLNSDAGDEPLLGFGLCLPVAEYVVRQQLRVGAAKCVKNLDKLTHVLRDRLFVPLRNGLAEATGVEFAGLMGVPEEVRRCVYGQLSLRDLQQWSAVCAQARAEVLALERVRRVL